MVDIILHRLKGLYMGPVAQIASMLVVPTNDNSATDTKKTPKSLLKDITAWIDSLDETNNNTGLKEVKLSKFSVIQGGGSSIGANDIPERDLH